MTRQLWLQYDLNEQWTEEELDNITKAVGEFTDGDVDVIMVPKNIELLDAQEARNLIGSLHEAIQ